MRYDCHIHAELLAEGAKFDRADYLKRLSQSGFDGSALYSPDPVVYASYTPKERMDAILGACRGDDRLVPFYWIEPTDEDASEQVDLAVELGFSAFKMIPSRYRVDSTKCLDIVEKIAKAGKPIMFHSGICWDGLNSADNHRPANYEALIEINNLRFCLAHVSWPWYDECIAVYGKFNNAYNCRHGFNTEMFIDVTPGTPRVFREEVFRHLLLSGYELRYNLMFGTDCSATGYNVKWSREWQTVDDELYERFIDRDLEDFKSHVYGKNFLRFIGRSDEIPVRLIPLVAE